MLTLYEWISLAQWAVMGLTTVLLWRMRTSVQDAVDHADHDRRLKSMEGEIERLRNWRHNDIVVWQQTLMDKLDERFVSRREFEAHTDDSPWPSNERRRRARDTSK